MKYEWRTKNHPGYDNYNIYFVPQPSLLLLWTPENSMGHPKNHLYKINKNAEKHCKINVN